MLKPLAVLALCASALIAQPAFAQSAEVALTRIDCGTGAKPTVVNERFSDPFAFPGLSLTVTTRTRRRRASRSIWRS